MSKNSSSKIMSTNCSKIIGMQFSILSPDEIRKASVAEIFREAVHLDQTAGQHNNGRGKTREPDAHFIQDDARDNEEAKDIEHVLRAREKPVIAGRPVVRLQFQQGLQGSDHVDKVVSSQHGQRHQCKRSPASRFGIAEDLVNLFRHN